MSEGRAVSAKGFSPLKSRQAASLSRLAAQEGWSGLGWFGGVACCVRSLVGALLNCCVVPRPLVVRVWLTPPAGGLPSASGAGLRLPSSFLPFAPFGASPRVRLWCGFAAAPFGAVFSPLPRLVLFLPACPVFCVVAPPFSCFFALFALFRPLFRPVFRLFLPVLARSLLLCCVRPVSRPSLFSPRSVVVPVGLALAVLMSAHSSVCRSAPAAASFASSAVWSAGFVPVPVDRLPFLLWASGQRIVPPPPSPVSVPSGFVPFPRRLVSAALSRLRVRRAARLRGSAHVSAPRFGGFAAWSAACARLGLVWRFPSVDAALAAAASLPLGVCLSGALPCGCSGRFWSHGSFQPKVGGCSACV